MKNRTHRRRTVLLVGAAVAATLAVPAVSGAEQVATQSATAAIPRY